MWYIYREQANGCKQYYNGFRLGNIVQWSSDQLFLIPMIDLDNVIKSIKEYSHFNHQSLYKAKFYDSVQPYILPEKVN